MRPGEFFVFVWAFLWPIDRDDRFTAPGCLSEKKLKVVEKQMLNAPFEYLAHLRDCDECYDILFRKLTPSKRVILRRLQIRLKSRIG
ncbi:MAG: hypothetical protein A2741_02185 [Candidatus Zambryskibacteria bacterium RIFCSPHIGHO2_01_FULL_43_27]|uniref:Uncharacterized protein n=1 Tax=Candidatus Zambryskibacteria bacterium RIFCSPLOWO2_01_FULL_43_17 TaxID=1802760 RepID=A0A1G2U6J5_9BACT|nr:MAG: hypothetical protein A2741_02185 [Candidatus Zambryskibacteria bacterium RIFCSPHIGHO2_01_FULL_43_27]OHB00489.1 MAG: hypothetical protein A3E93_01675 [Candidatus Zambryskibacteria bacterium RIFCSPHIGHO2_12_FULL_43_12b]OHB04562.1 MAG: hypothetical protein A2920_01285 [Candidatus Zambryskibacteria bacterium RIFCSPLOWO2_01_FULL_43_17]